MGCCGLSGSLPGIDNRIRWVYRRGKVKGAAGRSVRVDAGNAGKGGRTKVSLTATRCEDILIMLNESKRGCGNESRIKTA